MNFLRALIASLLSLICSIAVGAFVILATMQTTILDRNEAKAWISNSGIYQTALTNAIDNDQAVTQQVENAAIPLDTLKAALNQTFPPRYVQARTEKVINSTYDWLDGNARSISFEINTTDKKEAFIANLSDLLEPQVTALPQCASLAAFDPGNPPCIPSGYTPSQLADSLATDAANSISVFNRPLTNENIAEAEQNSQSNVTPVNDSTIQKLPQFVSMLHAWGWILPFIAVLSGSLMVLLSQHRLIAAKRLTGKLTFSLLVTLILGIAMATFGTSAQISDYLGDSPVLKNVLEPILHQALPAIGSRLAWISGVSALITGTLWITLRIIKKRREHAALLSAPTPQTDTPPISLPGQSDKH